MESNVLDPGNDKVLKVPVGTEILDEAQETLLADLTVVGNRVLLAEEETLVWKLTFQIIKSSPKKANPGQEGVERTIWLRLVTDVGLLGMPNAGKSTFLSTTSNARPK